MDATVTMTASGSIHAHKKGAVPASDGTAHDAFELR